MWRDTKQQFRLIAGLILLFFGAGFWCGQAYEAAQQPKAQPAPISFDDLIPRCAAPPFNGQILGGYAAMGPKAHTLEIKNGSGGNAIIKVRNANTGQVAASFFVGRNSTASFSRIPDGNYYIQYAFGADLAQNCRTFVKATAAGQFPVIETLSTIYSGSQNQFTILTYTLYAVPSGNVRPRQISIEAFEAE